MSNAASGLVTGLVATISALVAGEVPSGAPAFLVLLLACVGTGISVGTAVGESLERVQLERRIRGLAGELMPWRDVGFVGGAIAGIVAYAATVLIALI